MKKSIFIFLLLITFSTSVFTQTKPYVIVVSFDAFRWDYPLRGITPNLKSIAENGVSALSLRPSFPSKTFPNHIAIITGMYPEHSGMIANGFSNPYTGETYRMSDSTSTRDAKWYQGEAFWETAERQGIKTASYFWPGSELSVSYRRPSLYKRYDQTRSYNERVQGVIQWLKLPYSQRPHFITAYFEETDTKGHKYGPDSKQTNEAISLLDGIAGEFLSSLKSINMLDSTDIIFLSDHGMTSTNSTRTINIEKIAGSKAKLDGSGTVMMLTSSEVKVEDLYGRLKQNENHYHVYTKENIPANYHFSESPFIFPVIVIADPGWALINNKTEEKSSGKEYSGGDHGYDNNFIDMHGIFFAIGPHFKKGYKCGTLWNVDIYPLLCKIFDIQGRSNIDGNIERIEFLLNK
jgi:predicted AlkP superfamily pyrophosphatase or phosphodiesterase